MFTPVLKKIKTINPGIKTTVVLRKELGLKALAESQDYIDTVLELTLERHPRFYVPWIFWTKEYWMIRKRLFALLEGGRFDRVQIIYSQLFPTFLYLAFCPERARAHKISRLAEEAGVSLTASELNRPVLQIPGNERREGERVLRAHAPAGSILIGIQRNTMDRTRYIPMDSAQTFIDGLNRSYGERKLFFIVFANEASYALEQQSEARHLEAPNLLYSFRMDGGRDALKLAAMIENCDFILSVDSAVFNMACALGRPAIGVFNNYKVRGSQRALEGGNVVCIDSPRVSGEELLAKFRALYGKGTRNG